MKKLILTLFTVVIALQAYSQIYVSRDCKISFSSVTPVEDISAENDKTIPFINTQNGEIQMKISMTSFIFEKPLMQEHFNENYVESEKYPFAIFKGKINDEVDYTKDGVYDVTVTGTLDLHGVQKERTFGGTIEVKGGQIITKTKFKIVFDDHKIVIPALYASVIPPYTDVTMEATFIPYKKK